MTDSSTPIATFFERVEDYSKTTLKLLKLNAINESADVASSLIAKLVVIITIVLSVLIINIGLAFYIGKLIGETYYGFFVIGGFYALLAIVMHLFRDQLVKAPVSDTIIKQMLKPKKQ